MVGSTKKKNGLTGAGLLMEVADDPIGAGAWDFGGSGV